jgi:hypothetical protein
MNCGMEDTDRLRSFVAKRASQDDNVAWWAMGLVVGRQGRQEVARMRNVGRIEVSGPVKTYEFPSKDDR